MSNLIGYANKSVIEMAKNEPSSFGMSLNRTETEHHDTPLYTSDLALPDDLKAELIHCLNIGYSAQLMTVAHSGMTDYKAGKLAEIRAAIERLNGVKS